MPAGASPLRPMGLRLRLVGVPQLLAGDRPAHPGSRKAMALLALLALDGEASREHLAALLWPDQEAAAARRNLRRELFRLREQGVALAEGASGALALEPGLREALELDGEGRPLDGLDGAAGPAFDDWLQGARERLARRARGRRLALAQAAEAAGRLDEALAHFEALHAEDPLREITVRDLMRLHGARGQRAVALQVYEAFQRRARAELGVQPLPETQALAQGLREPGAAALPPAGAAPPLPRLAPFVGREGAVRQLREAWHQGRLMFVAGEAGEGKSRLLAEAAAAHGAFAHVACRPADHGQPFAAAARVLRELIAAAGPGLLTPPLQAELARVLPELGTAGPLSTPAERQQFLDACAQALRRLVADNFVALVVDDVHNADAASLGLLLSMAQQSGDVLRWLFAYRASETPAALRGQFEALAYAGAASVVALGPLGPSAVGELVLLLSGSLAPRFASRLHHATAGNPFFLFETLRHLFETGLVTVGADGLWCTPFDDSTDDYHELPLPPTVRDAVRARVARLGEDAMRLLEAASLLGGPFAAAWLAGCTSLDEEGRMHVLEAAEQAHLLAAAPGGDYRFTHDLVPQSLAAALSPARAALLQRRLALALEAAQTRPGTLSARIAHHWEQAQEPRRAVPHRLQAGRAAAALYAHREALAEFDAALAHGPEPALEVALRNARIDALRHLGDVQARAVEAEALMVLARRLGDRDLEADAGVQHALALADRGLRREALRVAAQAVALAPTDEAAQLRGLRIAAWAAMACGEAGPARQYLQRALPIAERIDASAACSCVSVLLRLACDAGDFDEAARLFDTARLHAGLQLRPMIEVQVLTDGARLLEATGRRDEALQLQLKAMALAERAGAVPSQLIGRFNHMRMLFNGGHLAEARAIALRNVEEFAAEATHPQRQYIGLSAQAQLAAAERRWADAAATSRRVVALCDATDDPLQRRFERVLLARALLAGDDAAAALAVAQEAQAIEDDGRRVLRSALAVGIEARFALEPGSAPALLAELEAALAAPALPEEEFRGACDQAALARARLLLACGRAAEVAAALEGVAFTPELVAQARALREAARSR